MHVDIAPKQSSMLVAATHSHYQLMDMKSQFLLRISPMLAEAIQTSLESNARVTYLRNSLESESAASRFVFWATTLTQTPLAHGIRNDSPKGAVKPKGSRYIHVCPIMKKQVMMVFPIYQDATRQNVLTLRSEFLALYIENSVTMHSATKGALRRIVSAHNATRSGVASRRLVRVAKRKIEITQTQYARNPQFREAVREAYGNRCAMCGVQLELIEAAHLVPHKDPRGVDTVTNGVALCGLHHRSLDTGLLHLDTSYSILINPVRRKYLAKLQRIEGFQRFKRQLSKTLHLPRDASDYPLKEYIVLGDQLRGIGVV